MLGEEGAGEGQKEKDERMKKARLEVLEKARSRARSEAIRKGAVPSKVYIHSEDVVDVAYVSQKVRVKVKAIGPLRDSSELQEVARPEDNPHWPYRSAEDRQRDEAAHLPAPQVEGEGEGEAEMSGIVSGVLHVLSFPSLPIPTHHILSLSLYLYL